MFKGKIYCLILIFLASTGYTAWFFHTPTPRDYHHYRRLMTYTDAGKQIAQSQNQSLAKQERINGQKQFIFNQDHHRLQWRLASAESDVSLNQNGNSVEFVESLREMKCTMQERMSNVMNSNSANLKAPDANFYQLIRCIEAKDAIYRYKHRQLFAEQVKLSRYRIPEHHWIDNLFPYKPFMEGQAQSIQLTFAKEPGFKAQGFQAIFQDWE